MQMQNICMFYFFFFFWAESWLQQQTCRTRDENILIGGSLNKLNESDFQLCPLDLEVVHLESTAN